MKKKINFMKLGTRRKNKELLHPIDSIRFSESFIIFISHNWFSKSYSMAPRSVSDNRNDRFNAIVNAVDLASAKYAKKMAKCYLYIDFLSIADGSSILDAMDIAMSLCDWVISISDRCVPVM